MINYIILTSLIITGIHISLMDGMIFGRIGNALSDALPDWLRMPLYECIVCMASIWGTVAFVFTNLTINQYIPFVFAVCGLNTIISTFIRMATNE